MPTVPSGIRCRAHPDAALRAALPRWIGCQRVVYNAKVGEDRLFAAERRLLLRDDPAAEVTTPLDQRYAHFKDPDLTPWLSEVPAQVLRNGAYRWMAAKQRQLKGLAKAPVLRKKHDFNSVLLTSELFRFVEVPDPRSGKLVHEIELGTEKHPVGRLRFKARAPYRLPKTIVVRQAGSGEWFVSFCFEAEVPELPRTPEEIAYELNALSDEALAAATVGLDRNTRDNCLADSVGAHYHFKPVERERMARKAAGRRRHQRRLARQVKGSKNREKTKRKVARSHEYAGHVRHNFAHQTSHALAEAPGYRLYVLEGLGIRQMTKKPKAKPGPGGKWLRNGAKAKAGLNKAILGAAWGLTAKYLGYKAARRNKRVIRVPPQYSSQECSRCGHTHPDNRDGARFVCQACGFSAHADTNAALVLKRRGIEAVRSGALEAPARPGKRVAFARKKKVGSDTPELSVEPGVSQAEPVSGLRRAAGEEAETCCREAQETRP